MAVRMIARTFAFIPGASPPDVITAMDLIDELLILAFANSSADEMSSSSSSST